MDTTPPHPSLPSLPVQPPQPIVPKDAKNPLPLDIFYEILNCMDRHTLGNCSLVAKSWTEPCQLRLFESVGVGFSSGVNSWWFQSRLRYISQKRDALLPRARKLTCDGWFEEPDEITPAEASGLRDFLSIFTRLEHFQLKASRIPFHPCELEPFSVFKDTLSCITLSECHISRWALLAFTNYFTNLDHLYLSDPISDRDSEGPSCSPRRLRKLTIRSGANRHLLNLLDRLSFDEVVFIQDSDHCVQYQWQTFVGDVLSVIGASVKYLRLYGMLRRTFNLFCSYRWDQ